MSIFDWCIEFFAIAIPVNSFQMYMSTRCWPRAIVMALQVVSSWDDAEPQLRRIARDLERITEILTPSGKFQLVVDAVDQIVRIAPSRTALCVESS